MAPKLDPQDALKVMLAKNLEPLEEYPGAMKPWKCKCLDCGNEIQPRYNSIQQGRKGCLSCSKKNNSERIRVSKTSASLSTTRPDLAKQAVGWDPDKITFGSAKILSWECELGHQWDMSVKNRTLQGQNCPICSGKRVLPGFNDLATTHPELSKEASGWDPITVSAGSNKKVKWICQLGHKWDAVVDSRSNNQTDCPYCSGNQVLVGFNDLATTHPELSRQLVDGDPHTLSKGSRTKFTWKCNLEHTWKSTVSDRTRGYGCPYCAGRKVLVGFNDLATTHPELCRELVDGDPQKLSKGSHTKFTWKCNLEHTWKSTVSDRTSEQGCPYCSGKKVLVGFNDLATTHPELSKEASGWDPITVSAGSSKKVKWICQLGHKWDSVVASRSGIGRGCPYCAGRKVLVGFNDLATTHPELCRELVDGDPQTLSKGSHTKFTWKCNLEHTWKSTVSDRTRGYDCPSCAISGFDPNKDAFLYFLRHSNWEMSQIGITNFPDDRLNRHKKLGWEILELRGPMDGHLTQQWETAILRMLKKKGADLSNEKIAGKFDGYSEAWTKATFPVESIKELMRLTDEFEEGQDKVRRVE